MAERTFKWQIIGGIASGFAASFDRASNTVNRLNDSIADTKQSLTIVDKEIDNTKNDIKELETRFFAGAVSVDKFKQANEQLTQTLAKQNTERDKLNNRMTSQKAAQQNLVNATSRRDKVAAGRSQARSNMMGAAESALVVAYPIYEAIKFESAMADVRKVVDFDSPEQFKQMGNDIMNMSKKIPMAANGLADIVASGGQAGIARDELTGFAESSAKMGVAFDVSAKEAGDTMAKWRTAFKMNQAEVNVLADKINYLGNTTAASAPQISDVVRRIGPLGEIGGLASGEIAALGASMVGAGIESDVSATGIKHLILTMTSGVAATKKQRAAFAELGFDAEEVAKKMRVDAKGALMEVLGAIGKMDEHKQAATLKQLFGAESLSAIAPLLSNLDNLKVNLDKVADSSQYAGSMEKEYQARIATTEAKLTLAKNAVVATATSVGNVLLPAVSMAANAFGAVASSIGEFMARNPGLAKGIAYLGAGVIVANVAFWAMKYAVLSMISPFLQLNVAYSAYKGWLTSTNSLKYRAAFLSARQTVSTYASAVATKAVTAAQWAWNMAMNANPIGLVVVAVAGLIAAGWALYKNWDTVTAYACKGWDLIKGAANKVLSFYVNFYTSIPQYAAYAVGAVVGFFMSIPERLQNAFNSTIDFFMSIPEHLQNAFNSTDGVGEAFVTKASDWGSRAYNSVISWFKNLPSALSNYISQTWEGMKSNFASGYAAGSGKPIVKNPPGGSTPLPGFAEGGRIGSKMLAWFAEESPEYAIPMNGSHRSVGLWEAAGRELGVLGNRSAGAVTLDYNPVISISGGGSSTGELESALKKHKEELKKMLTELMEERRRLSYD